MTVIAALVCGVLGVSLAISSRDEAQLDSAREDVRAGRDAEALARLDGLDGEADRRAAALRGHAYLGRGDPRRALVAFRIAVRRDPNNWLLQRDYAIVLLRLGERPKARARMRTALALNPRMLLPRGFVAAR